MDKLSVVPSLSVPLLLTVCPDLFLSLREDRSDNCGFALGETASGCFSPCIRRPGSLAPNMLVSNTAIHDSNVGISSLNGRVERHGSRADGSTRRELLAESCGEPGAQPRFGKSPEVRPAPLARGRNGRAAQRHALRNARTRRWTNGPTAMWDPTRPATRSGGAGGGKFDPHSA